MKKLGTIAAITLAAGFSFQAQAATTPFVVSSQITDVGFTLDFQNYVPAAPGHQLSLEFSGMLDIDVDSGAGTYDIVGGEIWMSGEASLFVEGAEVILQFDGGATAPSNDGIILNTGGITILEDGAVFGEVDFSDTPINLSNTGTFQVGFSVLPYDGLPLGDGTIDDSGNLALINIALAGLPPMPLAGIDEAVGGVSLFGFPALMFMEGEITLTEVPLPAAAWLFGSALLGLAGVARRRKQA